MERRGLFKRIGPAFVVGAVIIGPGSVTIMSTTGATYGYQLLWMSLLAGGLMAGFIALFMRLGIHGEETFLALTAKRFGRWYAVLAGISLFSAGAAFQCGNNLGVTAGMNALLPGAPQLIWPLLFTGAAVIFLYTAKNIYRVIEKMMTVFLVGMFLAFLVNLVWAKPDLGAAAKGAFIPRLPEGADWITLGGLVATTFVIAAAFIQSYLVKAKGWKAGNLKDAVIDTVLASITYTLIGTVIMMTAAAIIYPHEGSVYFEDMVGTLEQVFGRYAVLIFAVGFWAAAFSSFITNALIAGLLLADGIGAGDTLNAPSTRAFATLAMVMGTAAAVLVIRVEEKSFEQAPAAAQTQVAPGEAAADGEADGAKAEQAAATSEKLDLKVTAIRVGQACSLVAVPLGAIAMVVILLDRRNTPGRDLHVALKVFVIFGALVLLSTAVRTAMSFL